MKRINKPSEERINAQNAVKSTFMSRFEELREGRSNTEFAKFLGMSRQTVGFYLNGDRVPDLASLRQIAERCGVSADWLLGIPGSVKTSNQDIQAICKYTGLSESGVQVLARLKEGRNPWKDYDFADITILDEMLMSEEFIQFIFSVHAAALSGHEAKEACAILDATETFEECQEYTRKENAVLKKIYEIIHSSGIPTISIGHPNIDALHEKYGAIYKAGRFTELVIKRLLFRVWNEGTIGDMEEISGDRYDIDQVFGNN